MTSKNQKLCMIFNIFLNLQFEKCIESLEGTKVERETEIDKLKARIVSLSKSEVHTQLLFLTLLSSVVGYMCLS